LKNGYWQDLTTRDFAALDPLRSIALLPVGAIEQHGPHLPLVTDTAINQAILQRTLDRLGDDLTLLVLPTLPVGDSSEHADFPGTLSATAETLIALWCEIGAGVARAGLRKLVIFNSHGGQTQIVDIVAQRLRMAHKMLVVRANYFRFGVPDGLFEAAEIKHGIHGGALETSMMLHIAPELVRRDALGDFAPVSRQMAEENALLGPEGAAGFAWAAQDLHLSGAAGDATQGDAAKGARLLDHAAERLALLIEELARTPLDILREGPGS